MISHALTDEARALVSFGTIDISQIWAYFDVSYRLFRRIVYHFWGSDFEEEEEEEITYFEMKDVK